MRLGTDLHTHDRPSEVWCDVKKRRSAYKKALIFGLGEFFGFVGPAELSQFRSKSGKTVVAFGAE